MLPVGVWSMGEFKVTPKDEEQRIILKGMRKGDRAKLMYKLGNLATSYKHVYK